MYASQVMPSGQGYPATPGIHSAEQIAGWKKITDAVHAKGGLIFMQLWHVGRVSHTSFQPDGALPVAPSAIAPAGKSFTPSFQMVPFETPRALEIGEIPGIIEAYREGARNALAAGFDGVELHGANGYLIEQFLHSRSNHRTDAYGGPVENRSRLLMDVMTALVDVWGADRVVNEYVIQTVFFDRQMVFLGIVGGAFMGVLGSLVSVGRHLRRI